MNKKIIALIIVILGIGLIIFGFMFKTDETSSNNDEPVEENILKYEYFDNYIPGETYNIELNKETKELKGKFYHACSAKDCEAKTYEYTITLTDEELTKILKLWDDKEIISPILECLCENDKIMYESFEDTYEGNKEEYDLMDKNLDGKVTKREFGNRWLDYALEEVH